jgi:phosphatidylinositol alpha-mannosyltransferase
VKVGLVSPYDWNYPGGVQEHITHLAAELRSRGHTVRILTPATGPRAQRVEYGVYRLGWAAPVRVNGSVARVALTPDWRGRIRNLLRREQFDVLHLHEPFASTLPLTVLHYSGISSGAINVATFHACGGHGFKSTSEWAYVSTRPFLMRYFRRLHGRIAVSQPALEFVSRFFPDDYRIIPNGVDILQFHPDVPPLPQFMDGKLNIVYLGRLEPRKGAKFLLRAIPLVREHYPNTRFIFGGDGPLRPGFERLVQQHGWRDVVFTGHVPAKQLPSFYASANIYCAPNTGGESQGIVLLEAMAAGRPVVASNIAGFRTVIRHGQDGVLVPPSNHEELAWALCYLLGNEAERQRLAHAARARADEYSWERVGARIEAYYEELRAQHLGRGRRHVRPAAAATALE